MNANSANEASGEHSGGSAISFAFVENRFVLVTAVSETTADWPTVEGITVEDITVDAMTVKVTNAEMEVVNMTRVEPIVVMLNTIHLTEEHTTQIARQTLNSPVQGIAELESSRKMHFTDIQIAYFCLFAAGAFMVAAVTFYCLYQAFFLRPSCIHSCCGFSIQPDSSTRSYSISQKPYISV